MTKGAMEKIEDQAVDFITDFKVPRRARLGSEAIKTFKAECCFVNASVKIPEGTVGVFNFGVGEIEIIEDPSLPPDAVIVEE